MTSSPRRSSVGVPARVLLAGLALALLAGCVGYRLYHPDTASLVEDDGYDLAFVELDDQGELWSPAQVTRAVHHIEGHGAEHPDGIIVLVFVHGWNHDASERDANVAGFRQQLARILESERARPSAVPRRVVGVYFGWRGQTSKITAFNVFSFFGRRGAAGRIAGLAATEAMYRVLVAAKRNPRSRVVLIGHSFGGKILEAALNQALVGSLLTPFAAGGADGGRGDEVAFPADLVFMINPAAQSIHAKQFIDILERQRLRLYRTDEAGEVRLERPLIVSLTSEGDWATRLWFPAGLHLKGINKRFRKYGAEYCGAGRGQRRFFTRTAGHNRALISHEVRVEALPEADERRRTIEQMRASTLVRYDPDSRRQTFEITGSRYRFRIHKLAGAYNDTPYWIMQVPRAVMPGHAEIFDRDLQELLGALMIMTGAFEPEARTVLVREDGLRPLALAPVAGPGALFLDRSRRIYRVHPESGEPRFYACLPPELASVERSLGYTAGVERGWAARIEHGGLFEGGPPRTVLYRIRFGEVPRIDARVRIQSASAYGAATFDLARSRVFLARAGSVELEVAALGKGDAHPTPLVSLSGIATVRRLLYVAAGDQLFASDGESAVVRVSLGKEGKPSEVVAHGLEFPTAMAYDPARSRLYVATAGDANLWRIDCEDARCGVPRVFARGQRLIRPEHLLVTADGAVWVGDIEAQAIVAYTSDGRVLCDHRQLPPE